MKILWHSNAPYAATGYGQQTATFLPRLKADGHDVAASCFYGLGGAILNWNDIRLYPGGMSHYGTDVVMAHAAHHFGGNPKGGLVLTLVDVWVLPPQTMARGNTACWVPVDHDPIPPRVAGFFQESGCAPIAMSRFGEQQLRNAGLEPFYVPHGIDTEVFKPQDRIAARAKTGLPEDAFIVGMVAANKDNPSRKGFNEAFQAFAEFLKDHPKALLYLHTEASGFSTGVDLQSLLHSCGIPPEAVRFCDQYQYQGISYPPEYVATAFSAMDVLLNPSHGEGFGVPIIEAQACGTPVIVTDTTAMSELCGVGWAVPGQKFWTPQESWQTVPEVGAIVEALRAVHDTPPDRGLAVNFASDYAADKVYEDHWKPTLAALKARFDPSVEVVQSLPLAA